MPRQEAAWADARQPRSVGRSPLKKSLNACRQASRHEKSREQLTLSAAPGFFRLRRTGPPPPRKQGQRAGIWVSRLGGCPSIAFPVLAASPAGPLGPRKATCRHEHSNKRATARRCPAGRGRTDRWLEPGPVPDRPQTGSGQERGPQTQGGRAPGPGSPPWRPMFQGRRQKRSGNRGTVSAGAKARG